VLLDNFKMPSPCRPTLGTLAIAVILLSLLLHFNPYKPAMAPLRFNASPLHKIFQSLPSRPALRLQSPFVYRSSFTIPSQSLSKQPTHSFSTTNRMASNASFIEAVKARRSYYALNNKAPISDDKIEELVNDAVLYSPSSFNSQSTRVVVLLKKEHETFWEFVKEVLKPQVPAEQFAGTEKKLDGFKAGYGTVCDDFSALHIKTSLTNRPTDPLLRRSRHDPEASEGFRSLRRQIPTMERTYVSNSPVCFVDSSRGRRLRCQPSARKFP
jgi:hypothetical protein